MKFGLSDLEAFIAVADVASFRKAADALHLSQSALSRRIAKLEQSLGVRLFDRTTRTVNLTTVGREFAGRARTLLNDLEHSLLGVREIAQRQSGEVSIACVPSAVYYYLPNVIRCYRELFPKIRVRIVDERAHMVLSTVLRGEVDFGLNFIGTQEPEIQFEPILKDPFVAACRRDHPLARKRNVTWAELGEHVYMTVSKSSGNRLLIDLSLGEVQSRPVWSYETRHISTLLGLVEQGLGVAAVPRLAMPGSEHPQLVSVPIVGPKVVRTLGLIRRRGRTLNPAAEELYKLISRKDRRTSAKRAGD